MNRWILALLIFPLLVAVLPVKPPCTITIIARGTPLVLLVVSGHGYCCKIFGVWNNRLLSDPLWKLICRLIGWVPTRAISLWPEFFLDMAIFPQLWQFTSDMIDYPPPDPVQISTEADLDIKFLQSLVDQLINCHSVFLWKCNFVLRLLFSGSRFLTLLIDKIAVFTRSLLYMGLIGYERLLWYYIHATHMKLLDKLCNLLVLLNIPNTESGVRNILKDASDVALRMYKGLVVVVVLISISEWK